MVRQFLNVGVGSIVGGTVIGILPNPTGSAAVTNLKAKTGKGLENVGKTYPTIGKVLGVTMVLKPLGKIKKNKLLKGGRL